MVLITVVHNKQKHTIQYISFRRKGKMFSSLKVNKIVFLLDGQRLLSFLKPLVKLSSEPILRRLSLYDGDMLPFLPRSLNILVDAAGFSKITLILRDCGPTVALSSSK